MLGYLRKASGESTRHLGAADSQAQSGESGKDQVFQCSSPSQVALRWPEDGRMQTK
jgi:hypothetical protein